MSGSINWDADEKRSRVIGKKLKCEWLCVQYKPGLLRDSSCHFIAFNFPLVAPCLRKVSGLLEKS